jgi:hypothetical protein
MWKFFFLFYQCDVVQVPEQPGPRHRGGERLRLRRCRLPCLQRVCQGLQDSGLRSQIRRRLAGYTQHRLKKARIFLLWLDLAPTSISLPANIGKAFNCVRSGPSPIDIECLVPSVNILAQCSDHWVVSAFPVAFPVFLVVSGRSGYWKQNKFKRGKRNYNYFFYKLKTCPNGNKP